MNDLPRPPLRCVLLDVGGTLLQENPSRFSIYAAAAQHRGFDVDGAAMRELMRAAHEALPEVLDGAYRYSDPWFRAFIEHVFGHSLGLSKHELQPLTEELFASFESPEHFPPFPGAVEFLAAIRRRGAILGIVSNWSERLPRLLAALKLDDCFDFVLASAREGCEKPTRALFERALVRAGTDADATVHVGDHPVKDAWAARAVGIEPILIDHCGRLRNGGGSPDTASKRYDGVPRVESFAELQDLIVPRIP